jgi:hypothetical protein
MNVKECYDFIIKQISPEQALMKYLEGTIIEYEKLKFSGEEKKIHPLMLISMAAYEMNWQLAIHSDKDDNVDGLVIGTEEYTNMILKKDNKE